jgi:hypothetical protein
VARAFRNDAIVSLQFRPLLPTWTFTVVARSDAKTSDDAGGGLRAAGTAARRQNYFSRDPSLQIQLNRASNLKRVSENVYAALVALALVRQELAAAITALSSLCVSPPRKPRTRRNDWRRNKSAAEWSGDTELPFRPDD